MRTVKDQRGVTWICLELPAVPVGAHTRPDDPPDAIAIECNSGAERAVMLVPPDWEDAMDDSSLVTRIGHALQR
jgi:hypothetical protein